MSLTLLVSSPFFWFLYCLLLHPLPPPSFLPSLSKYPLRSTSFSCTLALYSFFSFLLLSSQLIPSPILSHPILSPSFSFPFISSSISHPIPHVAPFRGLVDLHAPVSKYWPAFGKNGKADITVVSYFCRLASYVLIYYMTSCVIEWVSEWVKERLDCRTMLHYCLVDYI